MVPDPDLVDPQIVPDPGRRPCRVTAHLRLVSYSTAGDDIGSRWRWYIVIDGTLWDSGPRTMAHGATIFSGELIHDRTVAGACGTTRLPVITVKAQETSGLLTDVGTAFMATAITCRDQPATQHVLIHVPVPQRTLLGRGLLWPPRRRALLIFFIDLTAACAA